MFEYGVLREPEEIRLLILFGLKSLAQPVIFDSLNEVLMLGGNVNYFDLTSNFDELVKTKHIEVLHIDNKDFYKLTSLGIETLELLDKKLPFTVRERTMKNALKVTARLKYDSLVNSRIDQLDSGCLVTCNINENGETLFEIKVLVANKMQADAIIKAFKNDPQKLYRQFIDILTVDLRNKKLQEI